MNYNKTLATITSIILLTSIIGVTLPSANAATSFITVDTTPLGFSNDHPWGLACNDPDFVWMTIDSHGGFVKIDKTDPSSYELFQHPSGVVTGKNWYSVVDTGTKLYTNERDNGLIHVFDKSSETFVDSIPLLTVESTGTAIVNVPDPLKPFEFTVDLEPHGSVDFIYQANLGSFGEMQLVNGFIWVVQTYSRDLHDVVNTAGVADLEFYGLKKIDPDTNTIVGEFNLATIDNPTPAVRGLVADGDSIWITDYTGDRLIQFDTISETIIEDIDLPAGTKPLGAAVNSGHVYVASNDVSGNAKVIKAPKNAPFVISTIDLGIPAGTDGSLGGVFNVINAGNNKMMWTDLSGNTGSIDAGNFDAVQVLSTGGPTNSNRFGCTVGDNFWFAGSGSVVTGITPIPTGGQTDDSGSDSAWKTKPTFGKDWDNRNQIVDVGFRLNDQKITITDNWHTPNELLTTKTGELNAITMKAYAPYKLQWVEFYIGVPEVGKIHEARSTIHIPIDTVKNKIIKDHITVEQENEYLKLYQLPAMLEMVECGGISAECYEITAYFIANENLDGNVLGIGATDERRRYTQTHINDGLEITGDSLNPPETKWIASPDTKHRGLIQVTQLDRWQNTWQSDDGTQYQTNDFGTFIRTTPVSVDRPVDGNVNVMDRTHSEFGALVTYEQERAKYNHWNSESVQGTDNGYFAYEFPDLDSRTKFINDNNLQWLVK